MRRLLLTSVAVVLRRSRDDWWHALAAICWRVNITWTGAAPLLHIQAVIVLTDEQMATARQIFKWQQRTCLNSSWLLCFSQDLEFLPENREKVSRVTERKRQISGSMKTCFNKIYHFVSILEGSLCFLQYLYYLSSQLEEMEVSYNH